MDERQTWLRGHPGRFGARSGSRHGHSLDCDRQHEPDLRSWLAGAGNARRDAGPLRDLARGREPLRRKGPPGHRRTEDDRDGTHPHRGGHEPDRMDRRHEGRDDPASAEDKGERFRRRLPGFLRSRAWPRAGRTADNQITFYHNMGNQGLQFAAVGGLVWRKAHAERSVARCRPSGSCKISATEAVSERCVRAFREEEQ